MKIKLIFLVALSLNISLKAQQQKDETNKVIKDLKVKLSNAKTDSLIVKYQMAIGGEYLAINPIESEKYFLKAYQINLDNEKQDFKNKFYCANSMVQNSFVLGKLKATESWMQKALFWAKKSNHPPALCDAYLNASMIYSQTQRLDKAILYAQRILKINDSLKKPENSVKAYLALGNIFVQLPKYDKALYYYKKVTDFSNKNIENKNFCLLTSNNGIAYVYQQKRQFDSCLVYANKAHKYALLYPQPDIYSYVLVTKAQALEQLKRVKEVLPVAREGLKICEQNNINHYKVVFYATMARALAQNKAIDSAFYYAERVEVWKDSSNVPNRFIEIDNTWAAIYAYSGNYKKAYFYKEKAYLGYEKVKEDEVVAQTTAADAMFETSKKAKQIEYLELLNKQQRKTQWLIGIALILALVAAGFAFYSYRNKRNANEILNQSNREKEVFLKEIHHRVKNNLQIISSLLYLQFKDSKDEKMLEQLKQAQNRIKSMSLVHNKLYETDDVVNVKIKEYITDLALGVLSSNVPKGKQIQLEVSADEGISFSLDTSISLGLMLNELITNSCKYAFADKFQGNINISMEKVQETYVLKVKDDGSGLSDNFEAQKSLGLKLIKNMVRQLGGTISFSNSNGTLVEIILNSSAA